MDAINAQRGEALRGKAVKLFWGKRQIGDDEKRS